MIGPETSATSNARLRAAMGWIGRPSTSRTRKCSGTAAPTAIAVRAAAEPPRPRRDSSLSSASSARRTRPARVPVMAPPLVPPLLSVERRLNTCDLPPFVRWYVTHHRLQRGFDFVANWRPDFKELLRRKWRKAGLLTKAHPPWHDRPRGQVS